MWRASRSAGWGTSRRRLATSRRGLSLLEAIAALAIVGATSAGVLTATGAGVRTAERARRAHEAAALAEEQLARLTLVPEAALQAMPDSLARGVFPDPFDDYAWNAEVQRDAAVPGLYTVQLTVEWDGGAQALTTALYKRPRALSAEAP